MKSEKVFARLSKCAQKELKLRGAVVVMDTELAGKDMEGFPRQGKSEVRDGQVGPLLGEVHWELEFSLKETPEGAEVTARPSCLHFVGSDGARLCWHRDSVAKTLGISEERYLEIRSKIALAVFLCETRTETLNEVLRHLKDDNERRAMEVILLALAEEHLKRDVMESLMSSMGGHTISVGSPEELQEILKTLGAKPAEGAKGKKDAPNYIG